ncbi:MAG TPA: molybdopterin molybdotransferase MoeA [Planctomycetota bacterium]|nr:molybdopterin molybdotransferase MoeA [Planctomycetota bacterium]
MLPFSDAMKTLLAHVPRLETTRAPLACAVGLVLAEDVASDVDMPPFDKSAMDGFAVLASDLASLPATLHVVEEVPAGAVPTRRVRPGDCVRIMTGAPVPKGADTVVRIEDTEPGISRDQVRVLKATEKGQNICLRAEDVRKGDLVLRAGEVVTPLHVPTLAACGAAAVPVVRRPTVAVLSTGNEVVPPEATPREGQIRDANAPYVAARLRLLGIEPRLLGIASDTPKALKSALARGMKRDALIVSGGVSAGDFDLVPAILREMGAELLFDSVAMQPGRPTVFARRGECAIFGLPGNPVSVVVGAELFVVPALKAMMGYAEVHPPRRRARLLETARHRPGRLAHIPGRLSEGADGPSVRPLPYHGSAHVHALSKANCLLVLPGDVPVLEPPATVEVVELRM